MGLDEKRSSKCTPARVKNCLKTFLVHLFSHVGLCVLVVGYAVIGGFIFRELEDRTEEDEKLEAELADAALNQTRRQHVSNLWVITGRLTLTWELTYSTHRRLVLQARHRHDTGSLLHFQLGMSMGFYKFKALRKQKHIIPVCVIGTLILYPLSALNSNSTVINPTPENSN